jgi:cytochrome P450
MADGAVDVMKEKRALHEQRARETPLELLSPARASAFRDDAHWAYFDRLRKESPVHWTPDSNYGAYWSITKYNDIVAVDSNHQVFSSASGITLPAKMAAEAQKALEALEAEERRQNGDSFIAMDEPRHSVQRKTVSPAVAPPALEKMAPVIRERAGLILDSLPIGEPFD